MEVLRKVFTFVTIVALYAFHGTGRAVYMLLSFVGMVLTMFTLSLLGVPSMALFILTALIVVMFICVVAGGNWYD